MSALSDLLNSGSVSARQAADAAAGKGIALPYGTLAGYWAGKHGKPSHATLKKLAQVVSFTEKRLQEAAWGESSVLGVYQPPQESVLLTERQRQSLDELIKSIVVMRGVDRAHQSTAPNSTPITQPEGAQDQSQKIKSQSLTSANQSKELDGDARQSDYDLAYRDVGKSQGAAMRDQWDAETEAPDPEGPDGGA